jgi:hypothetical protein
MEDYKKKLIEQIEEHLMNLEKALKNGAYGLIDHSIKEIVKLVNNLYEVSPEGKLTHHLLKEANRMKKTKNIDRFKELFNQIKW